MLVLSRKAGEKIVINPGCPNEIVIVCLGKEGGEYRIGVEAPIRMLVMREELLYDEPAKKGA